MTPLHLAEAGLGLIGAWEALHWLAPRAWRWLSVHKPRLIDQFRQIEAEAQPIVQLVEKETAIVRDDLQQKFAAVGAKLTTLKTERDAALASAAAALQNTSDVRAQLDAANAHIAELTAGDAEVESAVQALADQAG